MGIVGWALGVGIILGLGHVAQRLIRMASGTDRLICVYCRKASLAFGATVCPRCGRTQPPLRNPDA